MFVLYHVSVCFLGLLKCINLYDLTWIVSFNFAWVRWSLLTPVRAVPERLSQSVPKLQALLLE